MRCHPGFLRKGRGLAVLVLLLASCDAATGSGAGAGDEEAAFAGPDVLAGAPSSAVAAEDDPAQVTGALTTGGGWALMAWNDLGMHCLNPTYDQAVILPPYNTIHAQLVRKAAQPEIVTTGVTLEYKVLNNTYSYGKTDALGAKFAQFWDLMPQVFGTSLPKDLGLNLVDPEIHNGLAGTMVATGNEFAADGIPVTPVDDKGTWNPYQQVQVTAKDATGKVLATATTTIPTSDEINCAKCHGKTPFKNILSKHKGFGKGKLGSDLLSRQPVLCAGECHGSPVLNLMEPGKSGKYLSEAIHGFHATKGAQCYDCHPGNKTKCSRSIAHTSADGNCKACHGTMAKVASTIASGERLPWLGEPACSDCHNAAIPEVATGTALYRNSKGHGGMACEACHGSPHAMLPSQRPEDGRNAKALQGVATTIGTCGVCHDSSKGGGSSAHEFAEKHGDAKAEHPTACNVCHTTVASDQTKWPHGYQWKARRGTGTVDD